MKKSILTGLFILVAGLPVMGQLFIYGTQCGSNYSHYNILESNSTISVIKGSVGFHSGFFFRYDFESLYIGADLNYSSTLGGTIDDTNNSFNIRSGSVNMPGMIGKKFYPGIRLYVGGMPTIYIKTNENELQTYLETSPFTGSQVNGMLQRNDFIFFILAGCEVEISKFFVGLRYEHPLDYFVKEDFSTGGVVSDIDNYHYISQITFTVGYRFN
jgi:hypothetical protein